MGVLGDISKGILLFAVIAAVYLIIQFTLLNQITYALLFSVGLIIPIVFLAFEYQRTSRAFQCSKCNQWFEVSCLKLLFTAKFRGKESVSTEAVAYDLKCPNCDKRDWLTPTG